MKTIVTSKQSTNCTCTRRFSFGRIMMIACLFIIGMRTINSYGQSPCIPPQSVYNIIGLYISNVNTTGGLTNFTNITGAEAASYGNYSSTKIASQSQGLPLTIFATNGGSGMDYNVYVDYNDNGVFTDPGELVLQMGNSTPGTVSGSFTIPANAPAGTHRMRIRAEYFGADYPTGPCTQLQYGETEDYGLTVTVPCIQPTTQATIGSYTNNTTGDSITVNWIRGNGTAGVLVVGKLTSSALTDPSSGTSYTANAIFGSGTQIGSGNFVIYNGTGTSVTVSGLTSLTSYSFSCYEYNTTEACYKTPGSTSAVIAGLYCRPPQSVNYNCCGRFISNVTTTAGITNFTNTTGAEMASYGNYSSTKIASQAQGSPINIFATHPSSGMRYNVYVDYNDNGVFTDPGELVLQMGNTAGGTVFGSFTIPDNAPPGTHRMRVRAEESSYGYPIGPCTQLQIGETEDYGLTVTAPTGDYCIPAVSGLYNLGLYISNVTTTAGISNFTNTTGIEPSSYGNYSSTKIASQAQNSPITISATSPNTGMYYNVYVDYNDNGVFADPGELVLQMGKTTTGTITGSFSIPADAPLGTHRMRIRGEYYSLGYPTGPCTRLEYGETEDYGLTVTVGCTPPITQATIGSFTNNSFNASAITVNWARGNGNNVLVVGRPTSSALTDPSSGASYTANTIFGSGSQIGTGNFVVYNGTGTSVTVSGLSSGTSYTFTCYEYDNTGICYKNPGSALAVVPGLYCIPPPSAWDNGKYISNVSTTGGITNFTNTTGVETASYGNYSSTKSASQAQGLPITIFATSTVSGTDYNVYVDYNDNGVFTDPGELVLQMATASAGTVSGSFTIQDNAPLGTHRMRVRSESYGTGYPAGPCTQLQYGETEDYALTVTIDCTSPPTATITAGGSTTFCQGEDVILTSGSAASYLWSTGATTQSITVSSAGNYTINVTNANGCSATSAVTTVTVNQPETWYLDADNDGHYVSSQSSCGSPGAGYNQTATMAGDCNDADDTKWQSASLYIDNDNDGYDNGTAMVCYGTTIPVGYKAGTLGTDCNDGDASIHTPVQYYVDADHDGYGSTTTAMLCSLTPPAGYSTNNSDCNDDDASIHASVQYYVDADQDGYGSTATAMLCASTAPVGYAINNTDCNDNDAAIHAPVQYYIDADHDGYGSTTTAMLCSSTASVGYSTNNTDCNDDDAAIHAPVQYYIDADHDGFGSITTAMLCSSTAPDGYSTNHTDCNDGDAAIHAPVQYYIDADHDGYGSVTTAMLCSSTAPDGYSTDNTDCNDADATIYPGAPEIPDGKDNNCNGQTDESTLTAGESHTPVLCSGNSSKVTITATGGTAPYTGTGQFQQAAGTHTYTVKDATNAVATVQVIVTAPQALSVNIIKADITCKGLTDGKVTVNVAGGTAPYTYTSSPAKTPVGNVFSGLATGTYSFTVTDANGCKSITTGVKINQPAQLKIALVVKTNSTCSVNNGTITVLGSGGTLLYRYSLTGAANSYQLSPIFTGLIPGTYTAYVKDANGCIATLTGITIKAVNTVSVSIASKSNVSCKGLSNGSVKLKVSGGKSPYTYSSTPFYSPAGAVFSNLPAGIYSFTATDGSGCSAIITGVKITEPAVVLSATVSSKSNTTACNKKNGSVTVKGSGGTASYKFSINGISGSYKSSGTFTSLAAGNYTVYIKDANGCITSVSFTISAPAGCNTFATASDGKVTAGYYLDAKVLPNPTETEFTLLLKSNSRETIEIRVLDMYGKTVHRARGSVNDTYRFGSRFAVGVYVVQVLQGDHVKTIKVVKG